MSAIGYVRVSTDKQDESGLGAEAQEAAIRATAARLGLEVAAIFRDVASGSKGIEERAGLGDALAALGRGDVLLAAKRDRVARDPLVLLLVEREVARKRARLVSAAGEGTESDDPSAVLLRRVLDAVAEHERAMIRARTRAAMRAKKARGESCGRAPFGFREGEDGRLEADPREQTIVALVAELREDGLPLRAIVAALAERGVLGRAATPLGLSTVAAIVKALPASSAA